MPTHGPSGGVAGSLAEAKAAFRAGWERLLSERDMLNHDPNMGMSE